MRFSHLFRQPYMKRLFPYLAFIVLGLLGLSFFLFATSGGLATAANSDSVTYLQAAEHLRAGDGYVYSPNGGAVEPVVHFPPLCSLSIAGMGFFIKDISQAARWLMAMAYGAGIFLACALVYLSCASLPLALTVGALFALCPRLLFVHVNALSEPLFFVITLTGLIAFVAGRNKQSRLLILASALLFGFSIIARYSGVVWVAAAAFSIFVLTEGPFLRRFLSSIKYGSVAMLPFSALMLRNRIETGSATNRSLVYHPISKDHITTMLHSFAEWVMPWRYVNRYSGAAVLLVFALGVAAIFAVCLIQGKRLDQNHPALHTLGILGPSFISLYLAHVFLTICFLDYLTNMDERILSPVLLCGLILFPLFGWAWINRRFRWPVKAGVVAACAFLLGFWAVRDVADISAMHREGRFYKVMSWGNDEAMAALKRLPIDAPIYANEPGKIIGRWERKVSNIPLKRTSMTLEARPEAKRELEEMMQAVAKNGGALVYVYPTENSLSTSRTFSEQELVEMLPLHLVVRTKLASVYTSKDAAPR